MGNQVVVDVVPGQSYPDFTREFEAPVAAVFAAHADPDAYKNWVGPRGLDTRITQWDFRTGGEYRFEQVDAEGNTYEFRGVFHTVRENELIIQTFEFGGSPDQVSVDVLRFEALPDGRSRVVDHGVFATVDALEGMMSQGMADGVQEGYERLDELLAL